MQLTLTRHGGFAGVRLPPLVIDTAKLPPLTASVIERLLTRVDFSAPPAAAETPGPAQADRFSYTLTAGKETRTFSEATAEKPLLELVHALQQAIKK